MSLPTLGPLSLTQVIHAPSTDCVTSVVILASSGQTITPPSGARVAAFSFNADIWVTYGASSAGAASPSSNTSAGSTASAEFNPTIRHIGSTALTTAINIGSDFACKGTVSFYQ